MSSSSRYLAPETLASWLKSPSMRHGVDYQVIDVRDDDFAGGNIPGAVNLPSGTITRDTIAELAQRYDNVPTLVFHCAQSQQRGPKAARVFSEEYQRVAGQVTGKKAPQVYVLRNGFSGWQHMYHGDKMLVENYNARLWH